MNNCSPSPLRVIGLLCSRGDLSQKLEKYPPTRICLHRTSLPKAVGESLSPWSQGANQWPYSPFLFCRHLDPVLWPFEPPASGLWSERKHLCTWLPMNLSHAWVRLVVYSHHSFTLRLLNSKQKDLYQQLKRQTGQQNNNGRERKGN